jgi:hypothetical protein
VSDELMSARLRDLALVELDALGALVAAYADDVADALRDARTRIAALRAQLAGADPLAVVDAPVRQRGSDVGVGGADRARPPARASRGRAGACAAGRACRRGRAAPVRGRSSEMTDKCRHGPKARTTAVVEPLVLI